MTLSITTFGVKFVMQSVADNPIILSVIMLRVVALATGMAL